MRTRHRRIDPVARHLIHVEASMDAESWEKRERRFRRPAGLKYIPSLFPARFATRNRRISISAASGNHPTLAGLRLLVSDLMRGYGRPERQENRRCGGPEHHPILRTLSSSSSAQKSIRHIEIPPRGIADPSCGFHQGHAAGREADAILRKCVHCGFCLATCPTYQLPATPRRAARGHLSDEAGARRRDRHRQDNSISTAA